MRTILNYSVQSNDNAIKIIFIISNITNDKTYHTEAIIKQT